MKTLQLIPLFVILLPLFAISQPEEVMEAYNLHNAIKQQNFEKVEEMIAEGADVNYQFNGRNALYAACKSKSPEMVRLILNSGANVNDRMDQGQGLTVLQVAINSFSVPYEIVEILIDHGAEVNTVGPQGFTTLQAAISRAGDEAEALKIVKLLVENGAELNPEDQMKSATLRAAMHNRADMMEIFLKNGADPDTHTEDLKYPIHYAVKNKDVRSVRLLKEYGAQLDVKDKNGKAPLDYAKDKVEMMAFDEASQKKYQEIVEILKK